jgi:hypothetical protein
MTRQLLRAQGEKALPAIPAGGEPTPAHRAHDHVRPM